MSPEQIAAIFPIEIIEAAIKLKKEKECENGTGATEPVGR